MRAQTAKFSITQLEAAGDPDKVTLLLYYPRNIVKHSQEYYLYDLNSMISSVGGSLGLFLGFAIYNVLDCAVKKLASFFFKAQKEWL